MKVSIKLFRKYSDLKEEALQKLQEKTKELNQALEEYQSLLLSDGKTSDITAKEYEDKVKEVKLIRRHITILEERVLIYHEIIKDLEYR